MPATLAIVPEGFEELEVVAPIDLLRRAGCEVVVASLAEDRLVTGRNGICLVADGPLSGVGDRVFDCLLLPGGPGVKLLREDPRVVDLVRRQSSAGKWIAAICAAPLVLHEAGILAGRRFTAHASIAGELPEPPTEERVVCDGKIITSRGAGTAIAFGLRIVAEICGPQVAALVQSSIHA